MKLGFLSAFVCFFDLFSFDQNHLTLVFKGTFFAVLKSAHYNINSATCSERSRLGAYSAVSLGMQNPHLEHISNVLGPYTGDKNLGCKVIDSLNLSEFPYMCRILYTVFLHEPFLLVFGMAVFLLSLKYVFLSSAQKNIPSLSITHAVFKGKTKNIGC